MSRPPKPWERNAPSETTDSGAAIDSLIQTAGSSNTAGAVVPTASPAPVARPGMRPWERPGGFPSPSGMPYGSPYTGYGAYGQSPLGSFGGPYGGSWYGAGSSQWGGAYGRPNMFGYGGMPAGLPGGTYGGIFGSAGGLGGPPYGAPAPGDPRDGPPSAWHKMLNAVHGVMHVFGRLTFLLDENAHALHFFINALLQLLDRFGSLYGEIARFVLRLLGYRRGKPPSGEAPAEARLGGEPARGAEGDSWEGMWRGR